MALQLLLMPQLLTALHDEGFQVSWRARWSHHSLISEIQEAGTAILQALDHVVAGVTSTPNCLSIASDSECKAAFKSFLNANLKCCFTYLYLCGMCKGELNAQMCRMFYP